MNIIVVERLRIVKDYRFDIRMQKEYKGFIKSQDGGDEIHS